MKRKLISILLAASILSGCNNSTDPSATSTASDTAQETSATKETTTAEKGATEKQRSTSHRKGTASAEVACKDHLPRRSQRDR